MPLASLFATEQSTFLRLKTMSNQNLFKLKCPEADHAELPTWAVRWPSPTSPHRTCGAHCCLAGRRSPRKEYWTSPSQTGEGGEGGGDRKWGRRWGSNCCALPQRLKIYHNTHTHTLTHVPAGAVVSAHYWTSPPLPRTTGSQYGCHGNLDIKHHIKSSRSL